MRRFDSTALFVALDARREVRGLSWEQVAREIGLSASTIRRTRDGGRMEVDGMLAMVGWLGESIETFVRGAESSHARTRVIPQLRTTDLAASIAFYTQVIGGALEFAYDDFYAGVRVGSQMLHLKLVDALDPSIGFVADGEHFHRYFDVSDLDAIAAALKVRGVELVADVHDTAWSTRELVVRDNVGHTLYFGQAIDRDR